VDTANESDIETVLGNIKSRNSKAVIVMAASPVTVAGDPALLRGKRVLCVEDGPTVTHGEMKFGAAVVAAREHGAAEIVDPRPNAVGKIKDTFKKYPNIGPILPAMGYGADQIRDLQATIDAVECDTVVIGTPIDLNRVVKIKKPNVRVRYSLAEVGEPTLGEIIDSFTKQYLR
jgi:predicted GTPase